MKKAFVFCIGGTGLRVMKSITMLMAGGMSTNGYTIIPIILDPHLDLNERGHLNSLLDNYQKVYNDTIGIHKGNPQPPLKGFFNSQILRLHELDQKNTSYEDSSYGAEFYKYIETDRLSSDDINNHLINMLFSTKNLNNLLDEGFRGNPNVGTVVLGNIVENSEWFDAFKRHCEKGDRAFIISSIFGGTGASGFPLMEKKIKKSGSQAINSMTLGAVTVLPYYGLRDPEKSNSNIDSKNFYTKTKAALSYYYDHTLSNYLYYAGETSLRAVYDNNEATQPDRANFVELTAASALFDFLTQPDDPVNKKYLTRNISHDEDTLKVDDLGPGYNSMVKSIADFKLLSILSDILISEKQFPLKRSRNWDNNLYEGHEFKSLKGLFSLFDNWYGELATNNRKFIPISTPHNNITDHFISDMTIEAKDDSYFLLEMIKNGKKLDMKHGNVFRHFIETSYNAINNYTQKINEKK